MKTPLLHTLPPAELERLRVMLDEASECLVRAGRARGVMGERKDRRATLRLVTRLCAAVGKAERQQQKQGATKP